MIRHCCLSENRNVTTNLLWGDPVRLLPSLAALTLPLLRSLWKTSHRFKGLRRRVLLRKRLSRGADHIRKRRPKPPKLDHRDKGGSVVGVTLDQSLESCLRPSPTMASAER
jgi:hypothetical protein